MPCYKHKIGCHLNFHDSYAEHDDEDIEKTQS